MLVLYALVSFFCVLGVVVALQCPIGWCDLSEHSNELWSNGQVAFVLSLALTNIELLKVLPWKAESAHFDGFPTRKLLGVVIAISLLEDIPQLVLQVLFLREADHLSSSPLAWVSLISSLLSILWRGFKQCWGCGNQRGGAQPEALTMEEVKVGISEPGSQPPAGGTPPQSVALEGRQPSAAAASSQLSPAPPSPPEPLEAVPATVGVRSFSKMGEGPHISVGGARALLRARLTGESKRAAKVEGEQIETLTRTLTVTLTLTLTLILTLTLTLTRWRASRSAGSRRRASPAPPSRVRAVPGRKGRTAPRTQLRPITLSTFKTPPIPWGFFSLRGQAVELVCPHHGPQSAS